MCASWKNNYNLKLLISKLNEIKLADNQEPEYGIRFSHKKYPDTSFEAVLFDEYFLALLSSIDFRASIPKRQQTSLLREAIFKTIGGGHTSSKKLISEVSKLENKFLKKPLSEYQFLTSLSLDHSKNINRRTIAGVILTFSNNNRKILDTKQSSSFNQLLREEYPTNYTTVSLFVKAKSIGEAKDKATFSLDLMRGIWNFIVNRTKWPIIRETVSKPINSFKQGPITIGKKSSNNSYDNLWYEEDYPGNYEPTDLKKAFKKFRELEIEIRKKLNRSNLKNDLTNCFVRYATSLDEKDAKKSFIKLWSLLETMTDTGNISYDETVKRTAFSYKDYEYHKLILNQLREFRNDLIHKDLDSEYSYYHVYQLKRYIERLMAFMLNKGSSFNNFREIAEITRLSIDPGILNYQITLRKQALEFRSQR